MKGLFSVLVAASFFVASSSQAIVGGQVVQSGDSIAKSTVGLYFINDQKQASICTGTILNNQYVLTAAHCVIGVSGGMVFFSNRISDQAPQSSIRRIVKADFNLDYPMVPVLEHNDVALVRFQGGLPAGYAPAPVLNTKVSVNYLKQGATIVVAGYGITGKDRDDSGTLRKLTTRVNKVGQQAKEVYIGSDGRVACSGDSGGPAYILSGGVYYVWGIASRSDCETFSIYTRMSSNLFGTPATPSLD